MLRRPDPLPRAGGYVNHLGDAGAARVQDAYGATYDRLAALNTRYDPGNLFRRNHNVPPAGSGPPPAGTADPWRLNRHSELTVDQFALPFSLYSAKTPSPPSPQAT